MLDRDCGESTLLSEVQSLLLSSLSLVALGLL